MTVDELIDRAFYRAVDKACKRLRRGRREALIVRCDGFYRVAFYSRRIYMNHRNYRTLFGATAVARAWVRRDIGVNIADSLRVNYSIPWYDARQPMRQLRFGGSLNPPVRRDR